MYTKAQIYNLALGALLLSRQVVDPATENSNEVIVLNTHWETAFFSTLQDLDLDSTSTLITLELIEENPISLWEYAYKYPTDCAFFRRLYSECHKDNRASHIPKRIASHNGDKVIFTNEPSAVAEYISKTIDISDLTAPTAMAVAYRLAFLAAPLNVGKGAKTLRESIQNNYILSKSEAQELDRRENMNFYDPEVDSEFVYARKS